MFHLEFEFPSACFFVCKHYLDRIIQMTDIRQCIRPKDLGGELGIYLIRSMICSMISLMCAIVTLHSAGGATATAVLVSGTLTTGEMKPQTWGTTFPRYVRSAILSHGASNYLWPCPALPYRAVPWPGAALPCLAMPCLHTYVLPRLSIPPTSP